MNYEQIAVWSNVACALLFYVVIVWMWIKFAQPAVLTAQANANKAIAESERHRDEAKASLAVLRGEIEGAERDAAAIRARSVDFASRERDAALVEARDAGERSLRNASGELDRARVAAREDLRTELLDKALDLAKSDARTRVDAGLNAKLVGDFVATIEKGAN
ncbi:MAG: ATP synthase F0 subunit B [Candidatus Eremiobacteraeota bacterium]|nr:ATP synthase F0 subunit B [Candidatus Eremiobacteraeota bacterium]